MFVATQSGAATGRLVSKREVPSTIPALMVGWLSNGRVEGRWQPTMNQTSWCFILMVESVTLVITCHWWWLLVACCYSSSFKSYELWWLWLTTKYYMAHMIDHWPFIKTYVSWLTIFDLNHCFCRLSTIMKYKPPLIVIWGIINWRLKNENGQECRWTIVHHSLIQIWVVYKMHITHETVGMSHYRRSY